jgi:hypothetical protein
MSQPANSEAFPISTELSLNSQAAASTHSIAQRCYTHALLCVLAFLDWDVDARDPEYYTSGGDLANFSLVCKQWYRASLRAPTRQAAVFIPSRKLPMLLQSPTRRHVSKLWIHSTSLPALLLLAAEMPLLRILEISFDSGVISTALEDVSSKAQILSNAFPAHLETLSIFDGGSEHVTLTASELQLLVDALPCTLQLTQLQLLFEGDVCGELNLSPLMQLLELSEIHWGWNKGSFTLPQLTVIKQIPSLKELYCQGGDWIEEELRFLCSEPNVPQHLEQLNLINTEVTAESVRALARLPALHGLRILRLRPDAFSLLPTLTNLHVISFALDFHVPSISDLNQLCTGLGACLQLTILKVQRLRDEQLAAEFLSQLVKHVSQLEALQLKECHAMKSLHVLADAASLMLLDLDKCRPLQPGPDLLLSLSRLPPSLYRLHLSNSVRLSVAELQRLSPPSALIPTLEVLQYDDSQLPPEE